MHDPNGVIIGAVETLDDITEKKRAEEQLLAEKERLSITLGSIGEGVIATGTDKLITMMNKVAEQLTGWTQNEAIATFADVFRMMDENTRAIIHADLLDEVFLKSETTEISQAPILIGRDGTERVIAHTAAPINSDQMSRSSARSSCSATSQKSKRWKTNCSRTRSSSR